ncbi:MAG: DNA topoisomerase III, partial [Lutibacter sp.]|nr:DNA topoisomerase III [Lutibacter sp.]
YSQQQVYDIITRRFIAVFYEDCIVSNTAVIGMAADVTFKTTGKEIIEKGWRVVFATSAPLSASEKLETDILPNFIKGEKGPHEPSFLEKATKPPNMFSEATLLRAMETAGKQIDDDELRELMKENGIGRPSTRANIIETLFKRQYIIRNKKQILPTQTGIQLIDIIQSELLKSAELTGQWEKQLKEIEKGTYNAGTFIKNMKKMVDHLVYEVRSEKNTANIYHHEVAKQVPKKITAVSKGIASEKCPKCKKGNILKGKNAYGCSEYNNGCDFRLSFSFLDKKISENQYIRLLQKKCTVNLKGFKTENGETEGLIRFDDQFNLVLEEKNTSTPLSNHTSAPLSNHTSTTLSSKNIPDKIACPKCHKGTILKGKTAYGCNNYKNGCDFRFSFDDIRKKAAGKPLSAALVYAILNGKS